MKTIEQFSTRCPRLLRIGFLACCAWAVLAVGPAYAQDPLPKNPKLVSFESADHANAAVTGYELDLIRKSDNVVVQTLSIAKTSTRILAENRVEADINVQPVAFAIYMSKMRTVAGAAKSETSEPSNDWERSPGKPGDVRMGPQP